MSEQKVDLSFKLNTKEQIEDLSKVLDVASSVGIINLVIKKGVVYAMNDKSTALNYTMKDEIYNELNIVITDVGVFKNRVNTFSKIISTQPDAQFTVNGVIDQDLCLVKSITFICKELSLKMSHACGAASFLKRVPTALQDMEAIVTYNFLDKDINVIKNGISAYKSDTIILNVSGVELNININDQSNKFNYNMCLDNTINEDVSIKVDSGIFKTIINSCNSVIFYKEIAKFDIDGVQIYLANTIK